MSNNENILKAKEKKNDEFYTRLIDIEKELKHYKQQFEDKIIYLNCDNPEFSNFWKYFSENFENFKLKKLISTHYEKEKQTYKMEMFKDNNEICTTINKLSGNGDFRSPECIEILKEADIIVTNPPFSLFREYVTQLMECKKKFLIIGNLNVITYKDIFPLLKENKIWLGYKHPVEFITPDKKTKKISARWFTNLDITKLHEDIILYKTYNSVDYPKYDNYDAINVDKVSEIPMDYDDVMGVPITFVEKYNPEQFEIIGYLGDNCRNDCDCLIGGTPTYVDEHHKNYRGGVINGKSKYARILIKKK